MATTNPMAGTLSPNTGPDTKRYNVAGIAIDVLGLSSLPPTCTSLTILYLLHPRLQKSSTMFPIGSHIINAWNAHTASLPSSHPSKNTGLIAISFDQRNHGDRLIDPIANKAWREGNPRHAQDMFSVYNGTMIDTTLLLDHVGSYLAENFEGEMPPIERNLVLGVSLGGHAAWQLLFSDPRVEAGVVIIGCPDYTRVMTDRARLSKRETYLCDSGASFLGSRDFPPSLVTAIQKWDPRGILFAHREIPSRPLTQESPREETRLKDILESRVKGKSVLVCSGGADKLVPYAASEPFMKFLKLAVGKGGWWEGGMQVEDVVYEGVGHECTDSMVKDSARFVVDLMSGKSKMEGIDKVSKI